MHRLYLQAVGLALMGLLAGLLAPMPLVIGLTAMGTVALAWIAYEKSKGTGSGAVEMGMLIAVCIFFAPMALGLIISRILPVLWLL